MFFQRIFSGGCSVALMVAGMGPAFGQNYPAKPVRIVANEAGGGTDLSARIIAPGLASALGQPIVIDNRAGAIISAQTVVNAPPDGYTLLVHGQALWIGALLQKWPFDPMTELSPIVMLRLQPAILVVHPSLPVKTVKELTSLAKAKPGEINFASGAPGAISFLAGELFKAMAGINIVGIAYKGAAQAQIDVVGGHVQLSFLPLASVISNVKSGRLRAVAVSTAQPSTLLPGVPTVAASGLPGFEAQDMLGMLASSKTPAPILNRVNQETVRVINQPEVKEKLSFGIEVVDQSSEAFASAIRSDMARMGKLMRDLGLKQQ